jgi:glutathione S-transferase
MNTAAAHTRILWGAGSSRPLRALWMLHELELPFEHRPIRSRSGETLTDEYTRLNPSRKIPTLQDGDFTMSESAAIVNYLATAYGAAKNLAPPAAPRERARYDQWCFFVMMELDANTLYIIRRHVDLTAVYGEAPNAVQTARACYLQQAGAAAVRLGRGPYAMGERFTGADILLTSSLASALKRDLELPARLHEYLALTTARPAYRRAVIDNTPKTSNKTAAA